MNQRSFDYIIVGGGAAGCVLAAELARRSDASVALIERGRRDKNPWIHIPATFFKALGSRDAEAVVSEPDASLTGLNFAVPQGRVLGGGSSVNAMIYMRGQADDYDAWEQDHGCEGWSFADVLPIFRRQERNTRLSDEFHGSDGPLVVDDPTPRFPVTQRLIEACWQAGIPESTDFNGANQIGAGWYQATAHQGQRQSAAHCFLKPELSRENLTLITDAHVDRVITKGRRAIGVEVHDEQGDCFPISASKEVVLAAGSFQSPKLLMLSGIGPATMLNGLGIDVVHDNPQVGANWHDHVGVPVTRKLLHADGLFGADRGLRAIRHGMDYFLFKRGLLTSNLLSGGACVDSTGDGRADLQFNLAPFAPDRPGNPPLPFHAAQVHPMTMRPKSRSSLTLASKKPSAAPKFLANILGEDADVATLRRGVELSRQIFANPAIEDQVGDEVWPGKGCQGNDLNDAIRRHARTIFHPAGTCRMGVRGEAVVDPRLRVYGVDNLRVVDCSVMPALVSGNTNAPTMMIAGRAADFILDQVN